MELLKADKAPAEYKWRDVTFRYRTNITAGDKFAVDTSGADIKNGKVEFAPWEFYRTMIRVFVMGWDGVTDDGKPVPYSYKTFDERFPGDTKDDLVMMLGKAIADATGFFSEEKKAEATDLKNG